MSTTEFSSPIQIILSFKVLCRYRNFLFLIPFSVLLLLSLFCTNFRNGESEQVDTETSNVKVTIVPSFNQDGANCVLKVYDENGDLLLIKNMEKDSYSTSLELPVGANRKIECSRYLHVDESNSLNENQLDEGSIEIVVEKELMNVTVTLSEHCTDTTPPLITFEEDTIYIDYGNHNILVFSLEFDVTVTDPDGNQVTMFYPIPSVDIYNAGCYSVQYSATDICGNTGYAERTICVMCANPDTPMIFLSDTVIDINRGEKFEFPECYASDKKDGDLTSNITFTGNVDTNVTGVYTITISVTNSCGYEATKKLKVYVRERGECLGPPSITLIGEDTVYIPVGVGIEAYMAAYVDSGYTAYDCPGSDLTDKVVASDIVQIKANSWYISYNVTDNSGNSAQEQKRFFIRDIDEPIPPVIELTKAGTVIELINCEPWVEPGYAATDVVDGDISEKVVVDTSDLPENMCDRGSYSICYSVTNSSGMTTTVTRRVVLVSTGDPVPPVITMIGRNPDTILVNSCTSYEDPGATAEDNKDGDLTSEITVTSNVDCSTIGKYTVMYSVMDRAGMRRNETRTVWVVHDTGENRFKAFGVPSENPIPDLVNKKYVRVEVDGDGPDLSSVTQLNISWSLNENIVRSLAFQFESDPYYKDIAVSIEHTFAENEPGIHINGSMIEGLDGDYYVAVDGDELIWVKTDGLFALIWFEE